MSDPQQSPEVRVPGFVFVLILIGILAAVWFGIQAVATGEP